MQSVISFFSTPKRIEFQLQQNSAEFISCEKKTETREE